MTETPRHGTTRRNLLKSGAVAGAAAVAAGGIAPGVAFAGHKDDDNSPHDDIALVNGRIHTMDDRDRVVSEVLIRDGRVAQVGHHVDTKGVRTINLRGRTVIPGIIDSHTHIVLVGNRPGHHELMEDVFTIPEAVQRYQQRAKRVPPGEFITTIGPISAMQFVEQRLPVLAELDAVDRPVYIQAAQGGVRTNSLGKAWLEARGVVVADDGSIGGGATGSSLALQTLRTELNTPSQRVESARTALKYYAGLGITTHLDEGAFQSETPSGSIATENNFTMHQPFLTIAADGTAAARLRIDFLYSDQDPDSVALGERLRNAYPFFGNDMIRTGGIGEFFAPVPQFPVDNGSAGNVRFLEAGLKVAKAGWRAEMHSLTTTDFKAEIDGYALINQQAPITDLRWVVSHVPFITEEYILKIKALGGGLKVGWGPLRTGTNLGPPYRTILASGCPVGYHADGGDITVINPWLNFYTIITGKNLRGDLINDGQQLTREQTLRLATANNKFFIREDDLGSIEVGNHGDLVVLDRDFFTVPEDQIRHIHSLLTVVGGRVMHDAGVL